MSGVVSTLENSKYAVVLGLVGLGVAYGFGSWAIDTGSILIYGFCIATLYIAGRMLISGIKQQVNKDDGRRKAKKTRRA